jgi:hypothetical protein
MDDLARKINPVDRLALAGGLHAASFFSAVYVFILAAYEGPGC